MSDRETVMVAGTSSASPQNNENVSGKVAIIVESSTPSEEKAVTSTLSTSVEHPTSSQPPPPTENGQKSNNEKPPLRTRVTGYIHQQAHHVSTLTDQEVLEACLEAGITKLPRTTLRTKQSPIERDKLRDQLIDFKAFTQFINGEDRKSLSLSDGLPNTVLSELWVREEVVVQGRKGGTGLSKGADGVYKWVFWRDGAGVVRSAVPKEGNSLVKTARAMRWPSRLQRWRVFSFHGRDAHTPWEKHRYVNRLEEVITTTIATSIEKHGSTTPSETISTSIKATKSPESKILRGATENVACTLLRIETIDALKLYSQRDYYGFMDAIAKSKSVITQDLRHHLNRGPIFSSAMVGYALQALVKASLTEFIPHETFQYVRDIMYHYLANRNLHATSEWGSLKWRAEAFDTANFNAMNYLSDEFCDGFFAECEDVIRVGYGNTVEERCRSGAVVMALLYTACCAAMDVADGDNAAYAQNLVRSVGVVCSAAEALVLASPLAIAGNLTSYLLQPLAGQIEQKIQNRYSQGALRRCVVNVFRDTYIVGALRGERISGMGRKFEGDLEGLLGDEKVKFQELMKKRRELGRKFVGMAQMYVTAIGEEWPSIDIIDEEIYESLTRS